MQHILNGAFYCRDIRGTKQNAILLWIQRVHVLITILVHDNHMFCVFRGVDIQTQIPLKLETASHSLDIIYVQNGWILIQSNYVDSTAALSNLRTMNSKAQQTKNQDPKG